jgi:hypothetical protein
VSGKNLVMSNIEKAKEVLSENSEVLYGIFGVVKSSAYFPPLSFLNEFLILGYDPCDQDQRMKPWAPFKLTNDEYNILLNWWQLSNPNCSSNSLGTECWDDWVQIILGN